MLRLTQRRIDELKCPAGKKDRLVFDEHQLGLGYVLPRPVSPTSRSTRCTA